MTENKRLKGIVTDIEKTGETLKDKEGNTWTKCIYTVRLTGFTKRTPEERLPKGLKGKEVKLVRYACFDWHFKTGVRKTLNPEETDKILLEKEE